MWFNLKGSIWSYHIAKWTSMPTQIPSQGLDELHLEANWLEWRGDSTIHGDVERWSYHGESFKSSILKRDSGWYYGVFLGRRRILRNNGFYDS